MSKNYESVMDFTPRSHDDGWSIWYPYKGIESLPDFLFRGDIVQIRDKMGRPYGCHMIYEGMTEEGFPKNVGEFRYLLSDSLNHNLVGHTTITLQNDDFDKFARACSKSPEASEALIKAFCRRKHGANRES